MTAIASAELIVELEAAVGDGSLERRIRILRRVTNLFISDSGRLGSSQIEIFDDVMMRLTDRMEVPVLIDLSSALANLAVVPRETALRLASHENPAVAAPLLLRSEALTEADLIAIASNCGQPHLLHIAKRRGLGEALTDILSKHAGKEATRAVAANAGARFSAQGYGTLLIAAERDDVVAESLGLRADLPDEVLRVLLSKASETVRSRLRKAAPPQSGQRIQAALQLIETSRLEETDTSTDFAEAQAAAEALSRIGKLNDSTVNRFAMRRQYPNVVASLSLLSGAGLETLMPLMEEASGEGLIIACRAARLNWQTTLAVLNNRRVPPLSKLELEQAKQMFEMLYVSAAQYTIRFEPPGVAVSKPGSTAGAVAAAGGRR